MLLFVALFDRTPTLTHFRPSERRPRRFAVVLFRLSFKAAQRQSGLGGGLYFTATFYVIQTLISHIADRRFWALQLVKRGIYYDNVSVCM